MDYQSGKNIATIGFGCNLLVNVAFVIDLIFSNAFSVSTGMVNTLLNYGQYLSIGIAAAGFLIMWMFQRKALDLLSCGIIGLSVLLGLMNCIGLINSGSQMTSIFFSFMLSAFYIVLAIRAKKLNILFSLALLCAFIYQVFSGVFFVNYLYYQIGLPFLLVFVIWFLGYTVCSGLCFLEIKIEK